MKFGETSRKLSQIRFSQARFKESCEKVLKGQRISNTCIVLAFLPVVMGYLRGKNHVDPSFSLKYTVDGEGCLKNCFGVIEFHAYTTKLLDESLFLILLTNAMLTIVMLVGVNHNRKTVPFGCALVVDEKQSSFIWVLKQLAEAGEDKSH